ncbi:hypothetical protein ACC724_38160, partial [Rhizobium ruizarguesonis]
QKLATSALTFVERETGINREYFAVCRVENCDASRCGRQLLDLPKGVVPFASQRASKRSSSPMAMAN